MKIYYRLKNWYYEIRLFIKSVYQRITKGYAYKDTWSLDWSLAKWIYPRLKHLRDHTQSCPPNLELKDKTEYLTLDEWKSKMDKMLYAFEFVQKEDDIMVECYPKDYNWEFTTSKENKRGFREIIFSDNRKPDYTYYNECEQKYHEGMKLFLLYFRHLWD